MKQIVLGLGQIGTAIRTILDCDGYDPALNPTSDIENKEYQVLHICFGYSDEFVDTVKKYKEDLKATLIIIHSTVKVGTSDALEAVYSPNRGIHPDLEQGIRTFKKYFGGKDAAVAGGLFTNLINGEVVVNTNANAARSLEAAKLWDTEQYRENILLEKRIYDYCQENNVDFDVVYTDFNRSYNEGYESLGHPEYKKYVLKHIDGPIGGHCVEANHLLLTKTDDGKITATTDETGDAGDNDPGSQE
jgi:UDP-N-acetyl-D-mannosaminuronate dehydrogenase